MNDDDDDLIPEQHPLRLDSNTQPPPRTEDLRFRPRGAPFPKGTSGNPLGRPLGARNKATALAEAMLQEGTEEITHKMMTLAREGNMAALRLCFERVLPRKREAPIAIDLPPLGSVEDCSKAICAVIAAAAAGDIALRDAQALVQLIDAERRGSALDQLRAQMSELEATVDTRVGYRY